MYWLLPIVVALHAPQDTAQSTERPNATTASPAAATTATGFLFKTVTIDDKSHAYSIYVPPEYTADTNWPVILYFHGSGTRGVDGLQQTDTGIAHAIRKNRYLCPAIVVMPQCPPNDIWSPANLRIAMECVNQTATEYHLDPERLYVTGQSLGGAGAWTMASWLPDRVAAVAPICGFVGRPDQPPDPQIVADVATRLRTVPVWCFQGAKDTHVSPEHARAMVHALELVGCEVKYTEYPNEDHTIWDRVYADRAFWTWLLAQRKPAPTATTQPD